MIPINAIKNELNNSKIYGMIYYGDASTSDVEELGFYPELKKMIWVNPNPQKVMMLYANITAKHFRSHFSTVYLSDTTTKDTKRFEDYVHDNIAYLNLDQINLIKIGKILDGKSKTESKKVIDGFGEILKTYGTIKAISLVEDSAELEEEMKKFSFRKTLMSGEYTLYVRE